VVTFDYISVDFNIKARMPDSLVDSLASSFQIQISSLP